MHPPPKQRRFKVVRDQAQRDAVDAHRNDYVCLPLGGLHKLNVHGTDCLGVLTEDLVEAKNGRSDEKGGLASSYRIALCSSLPSLPSPTSPLLAVPGNAPYEAHVALGVNEYFNVQKIRQFHVCEYEDSLD